MAGKRVLVVDDEKLIVKAIRFSLEQDNMETELSIRRNKFFPRKLFCLVK